MQTLLDDNKVLTLINGDRIVMPSQVTILFEVEDLIQASPATVSRVGIVYLDEHVLGWRPFANSWIAKKAATVRGADKNASAAAAAAAAAAASSGDDSAAAAAAAAAAVKSDLAPVAATGGMVWTKDGVELLSRLFDKYVVSILAFKASHALELREPIPITDFNAVRSLTKMFDSLATPENGCDVADEGNYLRMIEM